MSSCPFTLIDNALQEELSSSPAVLAIIKAANIKQENSETRSRLDVNSNKDFPRILKFGDSVFSNLSFTSSSVSCNRSVMLQIHSGSFNEDVINQLQFALLSWMVKLNYTSTSLNDLTWRGKKFVKQVAITSTKQGQVNPEIDRGVSGTSAEWLFEVHCHFFRDDLLNYYDTGNLT